jgi:hypothetical protein
MLDQEAVNDRTAEAVDTLVLRSHAIAVTKGFWDHLETEDTKLYLGEKIALAHSELSEAIAADRNAILNEVNRRIEILKELADTCIRIFDMAAVIQDNIDVPTFGEILTAKISVNARRPYKHEKRY